MKSVQAQVKSLTSISNVSSAAPPVASQATTVASQVIPAKSPTAVAAPTSPKPTPLVQLPPNFPFRVPGILLEGDEPVSTTLSKVVPKASRGSEQSFVPSQEVVQLRTCLHLAARDPRCLYASWDLSFGEQHACNSRSADHHLVLRARLGDGSGPIVAEVHVHPESQHWFLHVDLAGTTYAGELGYYTHMGQWISLACSSPVATPSDHPTVTPARQEADFVRVTAVPAPALEFAPVHVPRNDVLQAASASVPPSAQPHVPAPGTEAFGSGSTPAPVADNPQTGFQSYPDFSPSEAPQAPGWPGDQVFVPTPMPLQVEPVPQPVWLTPEQEELLETAIVSILRPQAVGSLEFAEQLSRKLAPIAVPKQAAAAPSSLAPAVEALGISSPGGEAMPAVPERAPNFWFNVNAELVIYGATEPDAQVSIGNRMIRLREDGSFSYRFALPDGQYSLPIKAVATHGDMRQTRLSFRRDTEHTGVVGTHPQDPALKPPAPENIP